ncbi:MAG: tryptophan 2,3-dioxygenase family protein, partial [Bacteroidota bacterium]
DRFESEGLSLDDHLEGLLMNSGTHYWYYISVDTLLSLQKPITRYPNELIFITYHQICELYFRLCIHEIQILTGTSDNYQDLDGLEGVRLPHDPENWKVRLKRIIFYFQNLTESFKLMHKDLFEPSEFRRFRLALIPASGFQSGQFREMEIMMTSLRNLQYRGKMINIENHEDDYGNIYWKVGGLQTLKKPDGDFETVWSNPEKRIPAKTKTLINFEKRYDERFIMLAEKYKDDNLYSVFQRQSPSISENEEIRKLLSDMDQLINKRWKGNHFSVIKSQLLPMENHPDEKEKGTGGTNWAEYLPPKSQQIKYFPGISVDWEY